MSKINEYLNNIMKAVYGREVRQSIHDAIKEIDSVADTAQGSATEMARAAQQSAQEAETSKNASAKSAIDAKKSEDASKASQEAARQSETQAGIFADNAEGSATTATQQAAAASNSAAAARASEVNAKISETKTKEAEINAENSKTAAAASAVNASESAFSATSKAEEANDHAEMAKSYTVGTHGQIRPDDDTDCAGYYYEQTKRISQGLSGIVPMGTITFEGLADPNNQQSGYLFNISDSFTSDDRFADGGDIFYGAGSNVLYTADGKWDVLAASMVTGVKGNTETEFRQGFINLTPANIGALSLTGDAKNNIVSFTSADVAEPTAWTDFTLFKSKEKFSSFMNKISVMAHNLRYFFKLLGNGDISSFGDGTVTGAISSLNNGMSTTNRNLSEISQGLNSAQTKLNNLSDTNIKGYFNAYKDDVHHVGISFENYSSTTVPAIIIDDYKFFLTTNNYRNRVRGRIVDFYVDFNVSPWRLVIDVYIDGAIHTKLVPLQNM